MRQAAMTGLDLAKGSNHHPCKFFYSRKRVSKRVRIASRTLYEKRVQLQLK